MVIWNATQWLRFLILSRIFALQSFFRYKYINHCARERSKKEYRFSAQETE